MILRKFKSFILIGVILCNPYFLHAKEPFNVSSKNSLWLIKTNNNSVYLQGSVHLLKSDNYPLNRPIEKAFDDSQVLVLETDLNSVNDPQMQQLMLEKGTIPQGVTLGQSISKKAYELAKTKLSELGMDIVTFETFKPWFLAVTLTVVKLQTLGFDPQYGLDLYFFSKAENAGKQIVSLETYEYQLNLFNELDFVDQEKLIYQTLEDLDIIESEMDTILQAWASGDIKVLEETLLKGFKEYPKLYETFIVKRNRNWMSKIESFLKEDKNYMIIVGAGHLVGESGLVESLKKKGYSVEQL